MDSNIDLNLEEKKVHPYFLSPRALKIGKKDVDEKIEFKWFKLQFQNLLLSPNDH